ncbi:DUF6119 family protein [Lysinibacillus sp. RC79]|uniref:DUF6119 family protein n=1 Tax=Lysinibacillus sp. RC79 TaxID=3156296 RepID=UPI0035163BBB
MKKKVSPKKIKIYLLKGNNSFISYVDMKGFTKQYRSINKDRMGPKYLSGIIYVFSKKAAEPSWSKYLKEMGKPKNGNVKFFGNQDERALVFLKLSVTNSQGNIVPRTFVLTFGGGHHLLKSEYIVKDFATKISRLLIHPEKVTSIDSVTLERNTFHTRKSSSKKLPQNKLLVRGEISLIKKIHGRSKLNKFINTTDNKKDLILGGESGLDITGNFNLRKDLLDLLEILGTEYLSDKNDEEFNINELLQPVNDSQTKDRLNRFLENRLEKIVVNSTSLDYRNVRGIDIQPPAFIPFEDFTGIFITGLWYKDTKLAGDTELNVLDFFERLRILHTTRNKFNTGSEIVNKLKSCFIEIKNQTLESITIEKTRICSIFEALIIEFSFKSSRYVLFNGRWFEINYTFYSNLKSEIDSLPQNPPIGTLKYPKYMNRAEALYNQDLSLTNNLILMDQKDYPFDLSQLKSNSLKTRSTLEVCDALRFSDTDIEFIHVKRKQTTSGTSHLAAQAVASATAFNEIQNEIIEHINTLIPNDQPQLNWKNQNRHVSLVILNEKYTPSSKASSMLSVLETLTIIQNVHTLRELGYQVYLKFVE